MEAKKDMRKTKEQLINELALFKEKLAHREFIHNEQQQITQYLKIQDKITHILATADTLKIAVGLILPVICETLNWDMGAIWDIDQQQQQLHCIDVWHKSTISNEELKEVNLQTPFPLGKGLPGRVWANKTAAWIQDITQDTNFYRAVFAQKRGLHSAFAFPVLLKEEVYGVMEFFNKNIIKPDVQLLNMMTNIGFQISQFMEQKATEIALRKAYDEMEQQVAQRTTELFAVNEALRKEIDERKYIEQKLIDSESLYHSLFINSPEASLIYDAETLAIEDINLAAIKILGYDKAELLTMKWADISGEKDQTVRLVTELINDNTSSSLINPQQLLTKQGTILFGEISKNSFIFKGRNKIISTFRDITMRNLAIEAIKQSQKRYEELVDSIDGIVWEVDAATFRFQFVSRKAETILGYPLLRWLTEPNFWVNHIHAEDRDWALAYCINAVQERRDHVFEYRMIAADGRVIWLRDIVVVITKDDKPILLRGVMVDITETKLREERIEQQATLLDIVPAAIMICDFDNHIIFWNKGAQDLYGWTANEALGQDAYQLFYKEVTPQLLEIAQIVKEQAEWAGELTQLTKSGQQVIVDSRWILMRDIQHQPKSHVIVNNDITDKKTFAAQLVRAQRMESIGALASGIAHDLNNLFSPVLIALHSLNKTTEIEAEKRLIKIIEDNIKHSAKSVKQVLDFVRGNTNRATSINIKSLFNELAHALSHILPEAIIVETVISKDLWLTVGNITQLYQVLLNLCINARDAMGESGKLILKAENMLLDKRSAGMQVGATPGPFVMLTVADTGKGIAPEIKNKIFDLFFTTKEEKGTGLGLPTSLAIVKNHHGFINVSSEVGVGTTFKIYLPAELSQQQLKETNRELPVGHEEQILIVDDEAYIREITKATLEIYNYKVSVAGDSNEAILKFTKNIKKIQVVLIDLAMPHLDGPATIAQLVELDPTVKVISVSSLMDEASKKIYQDISHIKTFLPKPYTAEMLLETVDKVLKEQ